MQPDKSPTSRLNVTAILTATALFAAILLPALKEAPGSNSPRDTLQQAQHLPQR